MGSYKGPVLTLFYRAGPALGYVREQALRAAGFAGEKGIQDAPPEETAEQDTKNKDHAPKRHRYIHLHNDLVVWGINSGVKFSVA